MACASRPCASATKVIERSTTARMMHRMSSRPFGCLFDAFSPDFSGVFEVFPCFSGGFTVVLELFLGVPRGEEGPVPLGAPEEFAGPEDPELYDDLADEEEGEEHPESSTP